jgi:hypothetical protein
VPVQRVGEDAAEQHADRSAAGGDEPDHAHRLRPLGGLREERHDQRERDGGHDGGAQPLDGARADEELLRAGDAARERREREERHAEHEQAPVAEQVAEPAAEEQEAPERQEVGVHHPGERRLGEAEILADRRQRDVHDRRVEHDHEVAHAEHDEREPAGAVIHGHDGLSFAPGWVVRSVMHG